MKCFDRDVVASGACALHSAAVYARVGRMPSVSYPLIDADKCVAVDVCKPFYV